LASRATKSRSYCGGVTIQPRRQDRPILLGHPPHGLGGAIVPDQSVVIDEVERRPQPLDSGDLGPERPRGAGGLQRVTAEDEEHKDGSEMIFDPVERPGILRCRGVRVARESVGGNDGWWLSWLPGPIPLSLVVVPIDPVESIPSGGSTA